MRIPDSLRKLGEISVREIAAFRQLLGTRRAHPKEAIGEPVPHIGGAQFPAKFITRDVPHNRNVGTGCRGG